MQPDQSLSAFETFVAAWNLGIASLTVPQGIEAMLAFYRDVRADGCDLASSGDMLLYQWGTYNWGDGEHFELDITRQFITGDGEDDDISQLSLTFLFGPSSESLAVRSGNRWCESLDEREALRAFILSTPAYALAAAASPLRVKLDYGCAG